MNQAWIDLEPDDVRQMLVSLIGYRFGDRPEERIDEIRRERVAYAERFLKLAHVRSDQDVLDLGSGCGFGTAELALRVNSVTACDISPAYLSFARQQCAERDNVTFHLVMPRDLSPLGEASIDTVISMSVFIHLNLYDIYCYFQEFRRLLKPGGKVLFDYADSHRVFSRFRNHGNDLLFREHAGYYQKDSSSLAGLVQFNSGRAITHIARECGFRRLRKRGHMLLFKMEK